MTTEFKCGDTAFMIESNRSIRVVTILKCDGEFYTVRFEQGGGTKLRGSRLYVTREEAEAVLPEKKEQPARGFRPPSCWGVEKIKPAVRQPVKCPCCGHKYFNLIPEPDNKAKLEGKCDRCKNTFLISIKESKVCTEQIAAHTV